jgi:hypothetical protein
LLPHASRVQGAMDAAKPTTTLNGAGPLRGVPAMFIDTDSRATVIRKIDHALERQGWQRHDSKPSPSAGRLPHWTLDVRSAHVVQAWAFPVGPGTHHWYFSASWNPPGLRGQSCP